MNRSIDEFQGTDRFTVSHRLGAGGMGIVYRAFDRLRNETVALKTLLHADASAMYRLKREFRTLADVSHPNLVSLYELIADGPQWFFTMELIDGVNFLDHVRTGTGSPAAVLDTVQNLTTSKSGQAATVSFVSDPTERMGGETPIANFGGLLNQERLRPALRQLAHAVFSLHRAGIIHRDLKPSNVLVASDGRVVVLDFGLAAELAPARELVTIENAQAGTVAYMSPEQAAGVTVTRASDWYAVGVILYEALTGRRPHTGTVLQVLRDKQLKNPARPDPNSSDLPKDLVELCLALLDIDPVRRPTGEQVLSALGESAGSVVVENSGAIKQEGALVGRESHLAALEESFNHAQEGQAVSLYVHGVSGVGKSTLMEYFLGRLERKNRALVLAGRCYERETVPYKALDGVVDSLSRYLLSLPQTKVEALLPRDVLPLSRLFPVMLRVEAVRGAPQREKEIPDPLVLRRRAFSALRELLGRISDRQPLVLYIDDLQWADADSTTLLEDLLRPPDPPPLLLVACFRSEEVAVKPFLRLLLDHTGTARCRQLSVGPLMDEESRRLAHFLLGPELPGTKSVVDLIVREAAGSPFFVEQLARYALVSDCAATSGVSLPEMLEARIRHLPAGARQFLETLAVAGRPVDSVVTFAAASLSGDERPLVAALRAARLVRSSGSAQNVELYHDRIRETLAGLLRGEAVASIHLQLAQTLEANGYDDPDALFEHYLGASDRVRAGSYARLAAKKASAALAFDRAVMFFRRALELTPPDAADTVDLEASLGDALTNAGHSADAAEVYLGAAKKAVAAQSLELQRRAAQQLLISGHIDDGIELIRTVLSAIGMKLPATPRRALWSLLWRRLQLQLRGIDYAERPAEQVPADELLRIDICWAVTVGLALVDVIRAYDFQTRHLLLALRAGEPYRIARALAIEAGISATTGGPGWKRSTKFGAAAAALAEKVNHPHATGLTTLAAGLAAFCTGQWKMASEHFARSEETFREQCTGVVWELTSAQNYLLSSLIYLGELREIARRMPVLLASAQERGNLYTATELRSRENLMWLVADDPNGAARELSQAIKRWSHKGFHRQHYNFLLAQTQIHLYTGNAEAAWQCVTDRWPDLAGSLLLRIQVLRVEAMFLRARCALALAAGRPAGREELLQVAERMANRIGRERMAWSAPFVPLLRAAVAVVRGDASAAVTGLAAAADGFAAADMELLATAVRRRQGNLIGGDQGRQLVSQADAWMHDQKVQSPTLLARMFVPGFPDN